jgi:hypothetical protein
MRSTYAQTPRTGRRVEIQVATEAGAVYLRTVSSTGRPGPWLALSGQRANELAGLLSIASVEASQGRGLDRGIAS